MLEENISHIECEMRKISSEIEFLKFSVEVKKNASPAIEALYQTKQKIISSLMINHAQIKDALENSEMA